MRIIPFAAVCGIIFVIPWEEAAFFGDLETAAKSLGYLALALSLIAVAARLGIRRLPLAFLPLTLAVAWSVVSITWSIDVERAMPRAMTYISLLLFAWMIWEFGESENRICWMFRAYLCGCCISLISMFLSYAPGAVDKFGGMVRFTGGSLNENDTATILNIAVPMAAYLASRASRGTWMRLVYWAFIPLAAVGIFMTGSRMGVLVLGFGLLMTGIGVLARGLRYLLPLAAVVGLGVWIVSWFISEQLVSRLAEGTAAHTFKMRLEFWEVGLEYWQMHPLCGAGTAGFYRTTELGGVSKASVSHNTFITVLVEGGIVGAILMLTFWFLLLRSIWKLPKRERLLWIAIFGIWGASSMAVTWEGSKTTWFIYGSVMAFCALPKTDSRCKPAAVPLQPRRPDHY